MLSDLAMGAGARDITLIGCGMLVVGILGGAVGFGLFWLLLSTGVLS